MTVIGTTLLLITLGIYNHFNFLVCPYGLRCFIIVHFSLQYASVCSSLVGSKFSVPCSCIFSRRNIVQISSLKPCKSLHYPESLLISREDHSSTFFMICTYTPIFFFISLSKFLLFLVRSTYVSSPLQMPHAFWPRLSHVSCFCPRELSPILCDPPTFSNPTHMVTKLHYSE